MVKPILILATALFFLGAFSTVSAQKSAKQVSTDYSKANYKFLEEITLEPEVVAEEKPAEPVRVAVPSV
jgi:hypothetical protein